jgi:hypothetical protein
MLDLVFLRTEKFSSRERHTADAYGTADAIWIEVGIFPSGEGVTDFSQSAESKKRKREVT